VSRSSEQSEEEILPLPLRYTQSQGQNDKGKLGVRMTESEGARNDNKKALAMTGKKGLAMTPPLRHCEERKRLRGIAEANWSERFLALRSEQAPQSPS
jgi:hypothetical protein